MTMIIRPTTPIDLTKLNEIRSKLNGRIELPRPVNLQAMRTCIVDGKIVGIGIMKTIQEITAFIDPDSSRQARGESLISFIKESILISKEKGFDEMVAFSWTEDYATILEKHFGFSKIGGIPLILDI